MLSALGVTITVEPAVQTQIVQEIGIAFLFAPNHHPAMRHVMATRQDLGYRTVFNLLGPLANPAGAEAQVLGVYAKNLTGTVAEVLRILGISRAMVVHGDGLDEITTAGETFVTELAKNQIQEYTISPEMFGLARAAPADLLGGDPEENARILCEILTGKKGAARDIGTYERGSCNLCGWPGP